MLFKSTKEEAFKAAAERVKRLGSPQRVIEAAGRYCIGEERKVGRHYPNGLGWNFYPQY